MVWKVKWINVRLRSLFNERVYCKTANRLENALFTSKGLATFFSLFYFTFEFFFFKVGYFWKCSQVWSGFSSKPNQTEIFPTKTKSSKPANLHNLQYNSPCLGRDVRNYDVTNEILIAYKLFSLFIARYNSFTNVTIPFRWSISLLSYCGQNVCCCSFNP